MSTAVMLPVAKAPTVALRPEAFHGEDGTGSPFSMEDRGVARSSVAQSPRTPTNLLPTLTGAVSPRRRLP